MPNLILGILGSSGVVAGGDYQSIATVTVGSGGAANIEFTSIPSTYKHLQLRLIARAGASATDGYNLLSFNSDTTTTNYVSHDGLYADGSTVASYAAPSSSGLSGMYVQRLVQNNTGASIYQAAIIDILDYTSTSKNKTMRYLGGYDRNGGGVLTFGSGLYLNSSTAISSLKLVPNAASYMQYTEAALYGIKD